MSIGHAWGIWIGIAALQRCAGAPHSVWAPGALQSTRPEIRLGGFRRCRRGEHQLVVDDWFCWENLKTGNPWGFYHQIDRAFLMIESLAKKIWLKSDVSNTCESYKVPWILTNVIACYCPCRSGSRGAMHSSERSPSSQLSKKKWRVKHRKPRSISKPLREFSNLTSASAQTSASSAFLCSGLEILVMGPDMKLKFQIIPNISELDRGIHKWTTSNSHVNSWAFQRAQARVMKDLPWPELWASENSALAVLKVVQVPKVTISEILRVSDGMSMSWEPSFASKTKKYVAWAYLPLSRNLFQS